jgi:SAM-dependent methyltransferase
MGYKVIGIDIAENLVEIARAKLSQAGYTDSEFLVMDAQSLPFENFSADCINCCGPTLSFIPDWRMALSEMARCLKPGGKLLLEVEGKWNFDLLWEIVNALGFNFLDYDESLATAISHLLPPWKIGHVMDYSFKEESGKSALMHLKLFSASELTKELKKAELIPDQRWGLHVITNLMPSTILHEANPANFIRQTFSFLEKIEKRLNRFWPFNAFGCSLLVLAHKKTAKG